MKTKPNLEIALSLWSYAQYPSANEEWSFEQKLSHIKENGINTFIADGQCNTELKDIAGKYELNFAGAFACSKKEEIEPAIKAQLAIGDGPINCQLLKHDSSLGESLEMAIAIMSCAEKLGAKVYIETHRDNCTETPEKLEKLIDAYKKETGKELPLNFDYSHHGIVKHLMPSNYEERLLIHPELFQKSCLWHCRPFNGHHCQIPITDGEGNFSPEYSEFRPFIKECLSLWLQSAKETDTLWVVPELGPKDSVGYALSCFPPIAEDLIILAKDIKSIWDSI